LQVLAVALMLTPILTAGLWLGAQRAVEDRVRAEAGARGWQVRWSALELRWDGTLRLSGVEAESRSGAHVAVESARVVWRLSDVVAGGRAPARVELDGLDAAVDVGALKGASGGSGGGGVRARGGQTEVVLRNGRVRLGGLPSGVEALTLEGITGSSQPSASGWEARFDASCVEGCGEPQAISGTLGVGPEGIDGRVRLSRAMTVQAPVPGRKEPVALSLQELTVAVPRDGDELRVGVGKMDVPLRDGGWQATVAAQGAQVRLSRATRSVKGVVLVGPMVEVTRVEGDAAPEDVADTAIVEPRSVPLPSPARLTAQLERLLPRLEQLSIEGGEVHLAEEELTLGEVRTRFEGGVHHLEARMLGGKVSAELDGAGDGVVLELERVSVAPALAVFAPSLVEHVGGRVSGRLEVGWWSEGDGEGYAVKGDLEVEDGRLWHDGLSEDPLEGQHAWIKVDAAYRFARGDAPDRLDVRDLSVGLPSRRDGAPVWMHGSGHATRLFGAQRVAFDGRVEVDPVDCDRAVAAIPPGMLPRIGDDVRLTGRFAPKIALRVDLENPKGLDLDLDGLPGTCAVADLGESSPAFLNDRFTFELKEGVSRDGIFVGPGSGSYTPLGDIPEYVQAAMYLTEEIGFYKNEGFGKGLIRRALILNLDKGRYVYGGSTISQQLVKNLFLSRTKTLSRKLEEAFIVWRMEEEVDKERILELYLNCIEFGPDIYGIKRAARYYFDKEPKELTAMEGAYLAGLKPAPWNGGTFRDAGHTPAKGWWLKRHSRIMKRLYVFGHITEEQYREGFPFIVYFPNYDGGPIVLNDRAQLEKWGVEFPDDVIALGRADWAPVPTAAVETPVVPVHAPDAEPAREETPEGARWLRLDDLPKEDR